MNVQKWIRKFQANTGEEAVDWELPLAMSEGLRVPLSKSLAIFQLGETGTGSTLRRYVEKIRGREEFENYEEALQLFLNEEHRHAAMLEKMVRRLDGTLLKKQWANGSFRKLRKLINLEFQLQMLLTAELLAEAYYELLRRTVEDEPIRKACARIVKDEVGHTAFHAEFFGELQHRWSPGWRWLWQVQFRLVHWITSVVLWWDHLGCFRALGVGRREYDHLCDRAMRTYLRRMNRAAELAGGGGRAEQGRAMAQ